MDNIQNCSEGSCDVNETGVCIEGFEDLRDCPNFKGGPSDPSVDTQTDATGETQSEQQATEPDEGRSERTDEERIHHVSPREELDHEEANAILRSEDSRIVVVAGPADSGKTTLMSSLYSRFQYNSFAGYCFAGSQSLVAFEKRRHQTRVASGRITPDTPRTVVGFGGLLHLRLAPTDALKSEKHNLIFTDLAGEHFTNAKDTAEAVDSIPGLKRADHLAILLDGERLADTGERHSVRVQAQTLFRRVVETGVLHRGAHVQFVVTKWDIIDAEEMVEETREFLDATDQYVDTRFSDRIASWTFLKTAALPVRSDATPPRSYSGLESLLKLWMSRSVDRTYHTATRTEPKRDKLRQYEKLGL